MKTFQAEIFFHSKPFIFSFPPILTNHPSFFQKNPSGADIFPILHFLARPDAPDLVSRPTRYWYLDFYLNHPSDRETKYIDVLHQTVLQSRIRGKYLEGNFDILPPYLLAGWPSLAINCHHLISSLQQWKKALHWKTMSVKWKDWDDFHLEENSLCRMGNGGSISDLVTPLSQLLAFFWPPESEGWSPS